MNLYWDKTNRQNATISVSNVQNEWNSEFATLSNRYNSKNKSAKKLGAHILDLETIGFVTIGLGQLSTTYDWA